MKLREGNPNKRLSLERVLAMASHESNYFRIKQRKKEGRFL
jgi:hypothetical protein